MNSIEKLLEYRKHLKRKKPIFIRQDAPKKSKLSEKWRKPKGMHSKMRRKLKGHRKQPSMGYGSPRAVKFLTNTGLKQKLIKSINDIKGIGDKDAIVISSRLGLRKKVEILKKVKELKLKVMNIGDIDGFLKKVDETRKKKSESSRNAGKAEEKKELDEKLEKITKEEAEKKERLEKKKVLESRRSVQHIK